MVGIYFSGTGNTKFCTEKFLYYYESNVKVLSIEDVKYGADVTGGSI